MTHDTLEQQIKNKINTVIRQYELGVTSTVYIPTLREIEQDFFSDDLSLQEEGLKGLDDLLLTLRAWENYFEASSDHADKYKDMFVDSFNNFDEWYQFLEDLVADAQEYHKQRIEEV